jgi:tripeptidyl-peptidase I
MMILLVLLSLTLPLVSLANPTSQTQLRFGRFGPQITKHSWSEIPPKWIHLAPAPDSLSIRFRFALKQANIDSLIDNLYTISDPSHPRYGMHLTKQQVEDLVRPNPDTVHLVESWFSAHDLDIISPDCAMEKSPAGDWISLNIPVRVAEQMLDTKYNIYQHEEDASYQLVRTLSYSLPRNLHDHIDVVSPTTYFGTMKTMHSTALSHSADSADVEDHLYLEGPSSFDVPLSCNKTITPTCLMKLYGTYGYKPVSIEKNNVGITGYLEQFANFADLKARLIGLAYLEDCSLIVHDRLSLKHSVLMQSTPLSKSSHSTEG